MANCYPFIVVQVAPVSITCCQHRTKDEKKQNEEGTYASDRETRRAVHFYLEKKIMKALLTCRLCEWGLYYVTSYIQETDQSATY